MLKKYYIIFSLIFILFSISCIIGTTLLLSLISRNADSAQQILPGLYLGPETAISKKQLKKNNISAVLSVLHKPVKKLPNFIKNHKFVHVYDNGVTIDITNNKNENDDDKIVIQKLSKYNTHFDDCINWIDERLNNNENVLIHCQLGVNRSATMVIVYLMKKFNWTYDEAYKFVKDKRPHIRPHKPMRKQIEEYFNNNSEIIINSNYDINKIKV